MNNPFFWGGQVPLEHFEDRKKQTNKIIRRIIPNMQSTAIIGEPLVGKSSLLDYLRTPEVQHKLYDEYRKDLFFSPINATMVGALYTPAEFWESILNTYHKKTIQREYSSSPLNKAYDTLKTNHFIPRELEKFFGELHNTDKKLVLLIDEFDNLIHHPKLGTEEFFGNLRFLLSRGQGVAMVAASCHSVSYLNTITQAKYSRTGSPFFNFLQEINLNNFAEPEIHNLLSKAGGRFRDSERQFLINTTGGHPYLLQVAASKLWELYEEQYPDSVQRCIAVGERLYDAAETTFQHTWRLWSAEKKIALTSISLAQVPKLVPDRSFKESLVLKDLRDFGPEIRTLEKQGFIETDDNPSGYKLRAQALLWWLTDELIRTVRSHRSFDEWLIEKEMEGMMTVGQKQQLLKIGKEFAQMLQGGVKELIRTAATAGANQLFK